MRISEVSAPTYITTVCSDCPPAVYPVVRHRGLFREVTVSWALEPALSGDVSPIQGNITFEEGESLKNLTLFSVADEVKQSAEANKRKTHTDIKGVISLFEC